MDNDTHEPASTESGTTSDSAQRPGRRGRIAVMIGIGLLVIGAGVTATVLTISANQQRALEETLTAIAVAGQATNTAQVAQAQTRQADIATSTAYYHATVSANQTLTQQSEDAAQTAAAQVRETARAEEAAATQSVLDMYQATIDQAQANPPIFGPTSAGMLRDASDFFTVYNTGVRVANFVLEINFVNPYAPSTGPYDFGILFREIGLNEEILFSYASDNFWEVSIATQGDYDDLASGFYTGFRRGNGETNQIRLLVKDDWCVFYVNDEFVDHFDLGGWEHAGNIAAAAEIYLDDFYEPGTTDFINFTVWRLP